MTKKLLTLFTVLALSFQIASCTSNKSQDDNQVVENADVEKLDAEDKTAANPSTASDDAALQAALGEAPMDTTAMNTPPADPAPSSAALPPDVAAAPTLDETSLDAPPPATGDTGIAATEQVGNTASSPSLDAQTPPTTVTETTPQVESSGTNTALVDSAAVKTATAKPSGQLKKIAAFVPYKVANGFVNTVYVARPKETIKDIVQKIYSVDAKAATAKIKDLKKIAENSYMKSRAVKAGDKVYYVSPNRPDDSSKTLSFYEDMGMMPETYVAKKGDNLKKVAKTLLGYDKAYVEMWTSNPVESKAKLNEGEVLKYWRSTSGFPVASNNATPKPQLIDQNQQMPTLPQESQPQANAQANSQATMPPPPEMQMPPPPDMNAAASAGKTGQNVAANTQPSQQALPPPPQPETQLPPPPDATASLPPPPPPPPAEVAPPPPSAEDLAAAPAAPAPKKKKRNAEEEVSAASEGLDNNVMISLAAVGILTAAMAFLIIKRKKKLAAEQAAAMAEDINVGT